MYADIVSDVTNSRPLANFHPTIWGDYNFLPHPPNVMSIDSTKKQEHVELKEKVRGMLRDADGDHLQILELINAVQRLGVSYHFETEIADALQKLHHETTDLDHSDHDDLYAVALRFRLLRQHGYHVSCETFNKFKDEEGNFKEILITDIRGMLSLYEASHLSTHADEILDEALAFTTYHLQEFLMVKNHPDDQYKKQVIHALNRPLHRGVPRLETLHFISVYQDEVSHNETLHRFAKLDFNMIQAQHREELSHITKWWKDLDMKTKLPYVRDRPVEVYFWMMSLFFEPRYSTARIVLSKALCMISVMDDTYDAYATFEENKLFTKAIDRWDISCMDELPKYMQLVYGELLKLCERTEEDTIKEGRPFCVNYGKRAITELAKCYFTEAKWRDECYIPTMEEYMVVGHVTSGFTFILTFAMVGMGDIATQEAFHWLFTKPKIMRAISYIGRVMNDIVSRKLEKDRGLNVTSSVECYMKQYGVTEEDAVAFLSIKIRDAWKDINEEIPEPPKDIYASLYERMLNLIRATDVIYGEDEDGYTKPGYIKEFISSLLMEPIFV